MRVYVAVLELYAESLHSRGRHSFGFSKKRNDSFDSKVYQVQTKSSFLLMTLKFNDFQVTGLSKLEGLNYLE